jgi:hypothetical protein
MAGNLKSSLLSAAAPFAPAWGGALMPFLPHFGSVANLRSSPPEGLPHSALRAGDHHFPYGGVGIVERYDTKLWMRDLIEGAAYLPK